MDQLTENQQIALNWLRQLELWSIADEAQRKWLAGQRYYIDTRESVPAKLRRRFEQGNKEATGGQ